MILLVTPSARGQQCAQAVHSATGEPTDVVNTLEMAASQLRSHEYLAVVLDQFLLDAEPDQSDQLLQHLAATVPIYVNCAISGIERVVREVCSGLGRRKREEQVARWCAEQAMWSELSGSVTAMLLSCDLALAAPDIPEAAVQKIRTIHELAHSMRARLEHDKSAQA